MPFGATCCTHLSLSPSLDPFCPSLWMGVAKAPRSLVFYSRCLAGQVLIEALPLPAGKCIAVRSRAKYHGLEKYSVFESFEDNAA